VSQTFELFSESRDIIEGNASRTRQRLDMQERNFVQVHSEQNASKSRGGAQRSKLQQMMQLAGDEGAAVQRETGWTVNPDDRRYVVWESIHIAFVLYNSAMTPLLIAFSPNSLNAVLLLLFYLGDVIMLLDIALSFRVCFMNNGRLVSNIKAIRENYVRGHRFTLHMVASFPLDLFNSLTGTT